jgi:hypothetical protein
LEFEENAGQPVLGAFDVMGEPHQAQRIEQRGDQAEEEAHDANWNQEEDSHAASFSNRRRRDSAALRAVGLVQASAMMSLRTGMLETPTVQTWSSQEQQMQGTFCPA